jgi:acylphosphatase
MQKRVHILVNGLVQGVYFRHYTARTAQQLNLSGWVRNLRDGRVEILCEGNYDSLDRMVAWSRKGPSGAHVEGIDITWEGFTGEFDDFKILY